MKICIHQLTKHFDSAKAVDGLSFEFHSGQIFGFVGPNGAGKTTTMRIMATLDEPTAGEVWLGKTSVTQDPEIARRLIGYVPDLEPAPHDVSVHEYLDFYARVFGIRGNQRRDVVGSIEDFTNLNGIRNKMVSALSKGMKQRVSLARALVHDPPLLLMDEPAAGLDPRARIELRELLKILARRGKAVLISSHILSELAEMCDGAVIIERGRLLRAGHLEDILRDDSPRTTLVVRPLDRLAELEKFLLTLPGVEAVHPHGTDLHVEIDALPGAQSRLLTEMIKANFAIEEFRPLRSNLETIFMNVTKGDVQ